MLEDEILKKGKEKSRLVRTGGSVSKRTVWYEGGVWWGKSLARLPKKSRPERSRGEDLEPKPAKDKIPYKKGRCPGAR